MAMLTRANWGHMAGAAALLLGAAGVAWYGQPDSLEKWQFLAPELQPRLDQREVQIDPGELMELMHNDYLDLRIVDVRSERDWNLFHLWGAQRIEPSQLPDHRETFAGLPENGVIVLVSNDEIRATEAWKLLMAVAQRPNAYILAGGINRWLDELSTDKAAHADPAPDEADGTLRHPLKWALGARHPAALPDPHAAEHHEFTKKVKLQKRVVQKGGCG